MPTAAAIVGGAVIGAGGAVLASKAQSKATEKAAKTQAEATDKSIGAQERQFERVIELQEPFREVGVEALPDLSTMAREDLMPRDVRLSALFELQQEKGEEAINRAAAARGGFGSTSTVERLADFNRALIAEETERDIARQERASDRQYGRLLDLVNIGRGAATTSGAAGVSTGQGIGQTISQGGASLAQLQALGGQQRASTYAGLSQIPLQTVNTLISGGYL